MVHLNNMVLIISLGLAIAAPVDALFIYLRYKKKIIQIWLLFLLSLSLFLSSIGLEQYLEGFGIQNAFASFLIFFTEQLGVILCVYSIPKFFQSLVGIPNRSFQRFFSHFWLGLSLIWILLHYILSFGQWHGIGLILLLSGVILYCVFMGFLHRKKIGNNYIRRWLLIFMIISLSFSPFIFFSIYGERGILSLAHPIYLMTINVCCLIFSYQYLNQPAFFEGAQVTPHFSRTFNISHREAEVLSLILQGKSNQTMADELFVSTKTIEAHVSSLFRKTAVKNRVQLVNLVQSNRP